MMISEHVEFGGPCDLDEGVVIGYAPRRAVDDLILRIGAGATVRSGSVIYAGSTIGEGLETGHNVVIREENHIGRDFRIWSNSIVDYGCTIGDRVRVHSNVYIAQKTVIEDDVFLAPGVVTANDLHPICTKCLEGPVIRHGARIGINATILPRVTIGEGALVGAGSVVTKDVPPGAVVTGSPARVIKNTGDIRCSSGKADKPYPD
jgi:acetyltransferase-like isoleucine patch superfamily enzyme